MIFAVGTLLACLCVQTYGEVPPSFSGPRIVGGIKVDSRSAFHYQASIRYNGRHMCGGTILDSENILTAAHCCFDDDNKILPAKYYTVVVGDLNINRPTNYTVSKNVKHIFTHGDYNPKTIANDIAIMRISGTFGTWNPNVKPIDLASKLPSESTSCVVSGWGLLWENAAAASPDLYFVMVPIINQKTCKNTYKSKSIKSGMFCAGYLTGGKDACQGDSGGPLVCNNHLTGIVSWGEGCAKPNKPGVYTDVAEYSKWIKKQLKRNSGEIILVSPFILLTMIFQLVMF